MEITRQMCEHSEILLPVMVAIISLLGWLLYWEIKNRRQVDENRLERIEKKLDLTLEQHDQCQKQLPFVYVTKEDFKTNNDIVMKELKALMQELKDLAIERHKSWSIFLEKYQNHKHDSEGIVK
jgi:hypothetical protein